MPTGWTPRRDDDQFLTIAFWDQKEFLAHSHCEIEMKRLTKSIAWVDGLFQGLVSISGRGRVVGGAV